MQTISNIIENPSKNGKITEIGKNFKPYLYTILTQHKQDIAKHIDYDAINWIIIGLLNRHGSPVPPEKACPRFQSGIRATFKNLYPRFIFTNESSFYK